MTSVHKPGSWCGVPGCPCGGKPKESSYTEQAYTLIVNGNDYGVVYLTALEARTTLRHYMGRYFLKGSPNMEYVPYGGI